MKFHNVLLTFAKAVLLLASFSGFGWAVKHILQDEIQTAPAWLTRSVKSFIGWPDLAWEAYNGLNEVPLIYVETPKDFAPVHRLEEDVWVLLSYAPSPKERTVALTNLRTGEEAHRWSVNRLANANNRIVHPLMLADSSLVYSLQGYTGLIRIDKHSQRLWKQDEMGHHHSLNLGPDSTLWATAYKKENNSFLYYRGVFRLGEYTLPFIDNTLCQLDLDGNILYEKSILDILLENNLEHLLVKSNYPGDPLHINDCQPAMEDGPHWLRGDVMISSRTGSWIMHYRPSSGKVIRLIEGPFQSQHDVDFESDSTLVFFNNNSMTLTMERADDWAMADEPVAVEKFHSQLVRYYYGSHRFEVVENAVFKENDLFTYTEGLADTLRGGGYLVEQQNASVLWVIKDGAVLYKDVLPSPYEGYHQIANWARVYY